MKKSAIVMLFLILTLALSLPAYARNGEAAVTADYMGISISVNGAVVVPRDAAGSPVEPFAIGGTTYLPIRAVAGALGLGVGWDEGTGTVLLTSGGTAKTGTGTPPASYGSRPVTISYNNIKVSLDGSELALKDAAGSPVEPFAVAGTTYLPVRAIADALGLGVGWDEQTHRVSLGGVAKAKYALLSETARDASGATVYVKTYISDASGVLTGCSVAYPGGTGYSTTYTLDAAGNRLREDSTNGDSVAFTYDGAGRVLSKRSYLSGALWTAAYSYNADGTVAAESWTAPDSRSAASYTYDAYGNVINESVTVSYNSGEQSAYTVAHEYVCDSQGRPLTEKETYTCGGETVTSYRTAAYDAAGRVSAVVEYSVSASGARTLADTQRYTYDSAGNLILYQTGAGSTAYSYKTVN